MDNNENFGNCDTLDYFPLKKGAKPSGIGLKRLNYTDPRKNKFFQFDEHLDKFLENKKKCINEDPLKYIASKGRDLTNVVDFLKFQLSQEYPHIDTANIKTLHELAMLVPDDVVVHAFSEESDWAEYIHLCHANGWSANWAIGKSFDDIHKEVPNMSKIGTGLKIKKMIKAIIKGGEPLERIAAISFRTDSILNRHPDSPVKHKPFCSDTNKNLYIRWERQICFGMESIGLDDKDSEGNIIEKSPAGFIFLIRTYFVNVADLKEDYLDKVIETFQKSDDKIFYSNSFIQKYKEQILLWLQELKDGF